MTPKKIELKKKSRQLLLHYDDGQFSLSAEFLRVHSPSAEVRGHHPSQAVLQHGKKNVAISSIGSTGNYALQINFDDQHCSGIYSWQYLRELCDNHDDYWQRYLQQLREENKSRDPDIEVVRLFDPQ